MEQIAMRIAQVRPGRVAFQPRQPLVREVEREDALLIPVDIYRKEPNLESSLSRPKRLGFYSITIRNAAGELKIRQDTSALRVLNLPNVIDGEPINLLEDFGEVHTWKQPSLGDHILKWIKANNKKVGVEFDEGDGEDGECIGTDFICDSIRLENIMKTPFARNRGWSIIAIRVNGIIYLLPDNLANILVPNEGEKVKVANIEHMYRDRKFEQKITLRQDGKHAFLSSNGYRDSFYLVCKSRVGSHRLLYSHRSDCVINNEQAAEPLDQMQFAVCRTAPAQCPSSLGKFLRLSWWLKGVLNNSTEVIVGDESESNLTGNFNRIPIDSLPRPNQSWSPKTCTDFLDSVLTFIKKKVSDDLTPYRFFYDNRGYVFYELENQPVAAFLSPYYIDAAYSFYINN